MNITTAFIINLAKMPEPQRNHFLHINRRLIDFAQLMKRLKEMADQFIETYEYEMAEKMFDIKADVSLYEALQRFPAAVDDVVLVANLSFENKVVMEMSSVQ